MDSQFGGERRTESECQPLESDHRSAGPAVVVPGNGETRVNGLVSTTQVGPQVIEACVPMLPGTGPSAGVYMSVCDH